MITIIDYGAGNINSIRNMIARSGYDCIITNKEEEIIKADKLILPGVGNFDHGMSNLEESGILPSLNEAVLSKKVPILGICLGAQLMTKSSKEGIKDGLGWFPAVVRKFDKSKMPTTYKIPHMGWNHIKILKKSRLFEGLDNDLRYYFVHSFHFETSDTRIALAETNYGYDFLSGLEMDNIFAVQFHPEKSHNFGVKLMENFIKI
jgi:glutamine amidotransferase